MNDERRAAIIAAQESIARADGVIRGQLGIIANANAALRDLVFADDMLEGGSDNPPVRLLFCSPVTGKIETGTNAWGGDWFDATGYAKLYTATGKQCYHTGCDLNRPNFADAGAPICAAADGEIVFRGVVQGWQGEVVVIKHALEDGKFVWTRYAHIVTDGNKLPLTVQRGAKIGTIADYNKDGAKGDHLHYDVALIDLGARPGDWPGMDLARLQRDYIDPLVWTKERSK